MSEMLKEIDSWLEHIWLRVVKNEYEQSRILEESNLHSTVYFHLWRFSIARGHKKNEWCMRKT